MSKTQKPLPPLHPFTGDVDSYVPNDARSNQISHKGDTEPPFKISFEDLDGVIPFYFQNVIKPQILHNGVMLEVPVIYGSPERWKSVQKEGYYRDGANKIMAPLIMFKRDTISPDRTISSKIDANYPYNYHIIKNPEQSKRDIFDNFERLNRKPEHDYQVVVVPDYVRVTYNFMVVTYYMEQLNRIVEAINYASDSYWGDKDRFLFKARINSFNTPIELVDGNQRTARCSFDLNLFGHLIPELTQKDMNSIKKLTGKTKLNITSEGVVRL